MNKLSLLLVSLPGFVACAGSKYHVDVGPFFARPSGTVALQNAAGSLTGVNKNDFDDDMGLGQTETSPYLRLQMDKDRHRFRLHGFGVDGDGSGTLSSDFGGLVAGSQVTTSMEFLAIAANWGYQLFAGEHYRLAVGAQAGFYSLDVSARSPIGFEQVQTDVLVPMPFFEAEWLLGPWTIGGNTAFMSADLGDGSGIIIDAEAYVRWSLPKGFDLFGGYRFLSIDAAGEAQGRAFDSDFDVQGFFFGAGLRF